MHHVQTLTKLNAVLAAAKRSPLYRERLSATPSISSLEELSGIPLTTKQDLRDAYPYGTLAVPLREVVEVHTTSATTGAPTHSLFTRGEIDRASQSLGRAWSAFGVNEESVVQFVMSYGLFSGAMLNTYALQRLGAFVIPAGIVSAERQVELIRNFGTDTLVATPSYYAHLHRHLKDAGLDPRRLGLVRAIAAGEVYSEDARGRIEEMFGITVFDHYGLCEVYTGLAYECEHRCGLHLLEDLVFAEVVDPATGASAPAGTVGELVLTGLEKEASPVLRYRTGDVTRLLPGPCPCGRPERRIARIETRVDDTLFIRGIKINPHELKEMVVRLAEGDICEDIQIVVSRSGSRGPRIRFVGRGAGAASRMAAVVTKLRAALHVGFQAEAVDAAHFDRTRNTKVRLVAFED